MIAVPSKHTRHTELRSSLCLIRLRFLALLLATVAILLWFMGYFVNLRREDLSQANGELSSGTAGQPKVVSRMTHIPGGDLQAYLEELIIDDRQEIGLSLEQARAAQRGTADHAHARWVYTYMKEKKNGTFIEAGANDGYLWTTSLDLEVEHGWRGLLVEPHPGQYHSLIRSRRSAMFLEGCLSPTGYYHVASLKIPIANDTYETVRAHMADASFSDPLFSNSKMIREVHVECFPLYDIMVAAELTKLDALMLDVQGPELQILRTLPWDLVDIKVIGMENNYIAYGSQAKERKEKFFKEANAILAPHGYKYQKTISLDLVFAK